MPDSKGFFITDVDMILRDKNDKIMLLEVKRMKAECQPSQKNTLMLIHNMLRTAVKHKKTWELEGRKFTPEYKGLYLLQFENTNFEDGKVFLNRKEVSEKQLIEVLSMKN